MTNGFDHRFDHQADQVPNPGQPFAAELCQAVPNATQAKKQGHAWSICGLLEVVSLALCYKAKSRTYHLPAVTLHLISSVQTQSSTLQVIDRSKFSDTLAVCLFSVRVNDSNAV